MQSKDILRAQLEANYLIANKNIEGVSQEDSLVFPGDVANPMNWLLGHLVFSRNRLLEVLGGQPVWENFTAYDRGYKAKDTKGDFRDFEALKQFFAESHSRLMPLLDKLEQLPDNIQKDVTSLVLHEIYHCGQIGYMRCLLGKPGVIK